MILSRGCVHAIILSSVSRARHTDPFDEGEEKEKSSNMVN